MRRRRRNSIAAQAILAQRCCEAWHRFRDLSKLNLLYMSLRKKVVRSRNKEEVRGNKITKAYKVVLGKRRLPRDLIQYDLKFWRWQWWNGCWAQNLIGADGNCCGKTDEKLRVSRCARWVSRDIIMPCHRIVGKGHGSVGFCDEQKNPIAASPRDCVACKPHKKCFSILALSIKWMIQNRTDNRHRREHRVDSTIFRLLKRNNKRLKLTNFHDIVFILKIFSVSKPHVLTGELACSQQFQILWWLLSRKSRLDSRKCTFYHRRESSAQFGRCKHCQSRDVCELWCRRLLALSQWS